MKKQKIKIVILGASGYTGADLIRLASCHPCVEIVSLTANEHAGKPLSVVFPHLGGLSLPTLIHVEDVDWTGVDVVFCGLPHGAAQDVIAGIIKKVPRIRIVDMSADFRLRDPDLYEQWYDRKHHSMDLQSIAVYGLTEHYREAIKSAQLVACPGCYPTAALMALLPLMSGEWIALDDIIIDAKSGISGAGRSLKQNTLFAEVGSGLSPYSVGMHRHAPEIEQELSAISRHKVIVNFTPHLIPMSRGELVTCYVRLANNITADEVRVHLEEYYRNEPFIRILPKGIWPGTQHVRGSNFLLLSVAGDRIPGRAIVFAALDNLVKGSSGQALQNMNLMFCLDETCGLMQLPMFP